MKLVKLEWLAWPERRKKHRKPKSLKKCRPKKLLGLLSR
jgi:hypothetical protein